MIVICEIIDSNSNERVSIVSNSTFDTIRRNEVSLHYEIRNICCSNAVPAPGMGCTDQRLPEPSERHEGIGLV